MKNRIAVYGTLKRGRGNWNYFLKDSSTYIGTGRTVVKRHITNGGGFPFVSQTPYENGVHVLVEIYLVDDETLEDLNSLEGYSYPNCAYNLYERGEIEVYSNSEDRVVNCTIYYKDITSPANFGNTYMAEDGNWEDTQTEDEVMSPNNIINEKLNQTSETWKNTFING